MLSTNDLQEAYWEGRRIGNSEREFEINKLRKKVKELENLSNTNIEERDRLVTENAEFRKKLQTQHETADEFKKLYQATLDAYHRVLEKNRACNDIIEEREKEITRILGIADHQCLDIVELKSQIQRLQECDYLSTEKLQLFCVEQTKKFQETALKLLFPALKEENDSLKQENQKLKGLIEEAKKHVGMANLMLA